MQLSNFIKYITVYLFVLLSLTCSAQKKDKHSKIIQLSEHKYVQDCSNYQYQLKRKPIFIDGQVKLEGCLFKELRSFAMSQQLGTALSCDIIIRVFPDGKNKLISVISDKGKNKEKVEEVTKRIFLGNNKWMSPIFLDKRNPTVDIEVSVSLYPRRICYDVHLLFIDVCEGEIHKGVIDIWL
jgi:hypothetical protein